MIPRLNTDDAPGVQQQAGAEADHVAWHVQEEDIGQYTGCFEQLSGTLCRPPRSGSLKSKPCFEGKGSSWARVNAV